MAKLSINNVAIRGISACVPQHVEENLTLPVFDEGEAERVMAQSGIERKHKVGDAPVTASDLCEKAFHQLINDLGWDIESIDLLGFVTLTPDYLEPPTACIMHGRLGLSEECMSLDITQGCPGWINGMATVASLLSHGGMKRAILLNGDTASKMRSPYDKESLPLFGDAGVATALEFEEGASVMQFDFGSRGKDWNAIYRPAGGFRTPITKESLEYKDLAPHISRRDIDAVMDGMSVFSFGISTAPQSVQSLCKHFDINLEGIDYFVMHQANKFLNERIRKKLKIDAGKTPYSLKDYGNTSGASIPLTIVTQCHEDFASKKLDNVACAFGVGLAWASMHFQTDCIVCPEILYL